MIKMSAIDQEELIREAELYEEMKDLAKLKKISDLKINVFNQRNFKLRALVLENLKNLTKMQIKALDEQYSLIGLDKECWTNEEHFLHDLERKITAEGNTSQSESLIKNAIKIEDKEVRKIKLLTSLVKGYIVLCYNELKMIDIENLLEIKRAILQEEKKIEEIDNMIIIERKEEERVARNEFG